MFLLGLKAEDGSTVSISKSAMFSDESYADDLNKVIGRLTMDIAGNKGNQKTGNFNNHGNKKPKYNVSEVGVDDTGKLSGQTHQHQVASSTVCLYRQFLLRSRCTLVSCFHDC